MNKVSVDYDLNYLLNAMNSIAGKMAMGMNIEVFDNYSVKEKETLIVLKDLYLNFTTMENALEIIPLAIDVKIAKHLSSQILEGLFPSFKKEIKYYNNKLYTNEALGFGGAVWWDLVDNKPIVREIHVGLPITEATISTFNHERVHALFFANVDMSKVGINNLELLAILAGSMTGHYLKIVHQAPNVSLITDYYRLKGIKRNLEKEESTKEMIISEVGIDEEDDIFHETNKIVYNYRNITAIDYLLSNCQANVLFLRYLEDEKLMCKKIEEVLKNEITINDLLTFYNVSLENNEIIDLANDQINRIQKIRVIS